MSGPAPAGAVVGEDGVARCPWAARPGRMRDYHDEEWGRPVRDERGLFERVVLEGFQAGLSWSTILDKRENFRVAFHGFDVERVAAISDEEVELLVTDAGIVRHRGKITAARTNARATIVLRDEGGLPALVESYRPAESPTPRTAAEVPTVSAESTALSKALRARGFAFVGPTTVHALMEATGVVDTHLVDCHRRGVSGR